MKSIDVIVSRDGSSRVETHGFNGDKCREASKFVEEALGLKHEEKLTADYYRTEVSHEQQARQQ